MVLLEGIWATSEEPWGSGGLSDDMLGVVDPPPESLIISRCPQAFQLALQPIVRHSRPQACPEVVGKGIWGVAEASE